VSDDLTRFRPYLLALARLHLAGRPGPDPSDIVQNTLLDAVQGFDRFRGTTDAERAAWLRAALAHNLADADKHRLREKRDVRRERSLDAELDESSSRLGGLLAGNAPSPSAVAAAHERAVLLAAALESLPASQREAVVLQHWHGLTLAQIGERMGKSPEAVAGLLKRGLRGLRERLA
jgi:RNA polymerase sigma-70 factor, ECF subfamily